jgi:hypothetical protein
MYKYMLGVGQDSSGPCTATYKICHDWKLSPIDNDLVQT